LKVEKQINEAEVARWRRLLRTREARADDLEFDLERAREGIEDALGHLRALTGCDCVGLGLTCSGHERADGAA
jgi:hypothetical protein